MSTHALIIYNHYIFEEIYRFWAAKVKGFLKFNKKSSKTVAKRLEIFLSYVSLWWYTLTMSCDGK